MGAAMNEEMNVQLMSEESVRALHGYLSTIPGIHVLSADDPLEAINGFVSCHGTTDDGQREGDPSFYFGYRYAKPVPKDARLPILPDAFDDDELGAQVIAMIRRCVTFPGFVRRDSPMQLWMGFVKYATLDSEDETEALFIPVHLFKRLPDGVKAQVEEWRKKQSRELGVSFVSIKNVSTMTCWKYEEVRYD
jgi:hypothetical protein